MNEIEKCFRESPFYSRKHFGYFEAYQTLLEKYRERKSLVLVEVGVLEGGSLFMWRSFFPEARIIGIDLNPMAKKWEQYGFEIHTGSQSDRKFWSDFFRDVGDVDVLIDDGGHTSLQQAITFTECVPNISSGGMLIVEDLHTSYQREFANPSRNSFAASIFRQLHSMNPISRDDNFSRHIRSVTLFSSLIAFHVERTAKQENYQVVENHGERDHAGDFRYRDSAAGKVALKFLNQFGGGSGNIASVARRVIGTIIKKFSGVFFLWSMSFENRESSKILKRWSSSSLKH